MKVNMNIKQHSRSFVSFFLIKQELVVLSMSIIVRYLQSSQCTLLSFMKGKVEMEGRRK